MEEHFVHSIKVPIQYKKAAKIVKQTLEEGGSAKSLIFQEKHARTTSLYGLISKISQNKLLVDRLIEESEILKNEPRLDPNLCLVLVTELMFGAKCLKGSSKPVECVRSYQEKFEKIIGEQPANVQGK